MFACGSFTMNLVKTCAITGHRFASLPFKNDENHPGCIRLKDVLRMELIDLIERDNVGIFLTGMALGIDQFAAESILQLKTQYPHIQLHAYIPCRSQYEKWNPAQTARYRVILKEADEIIFTAETYTAGCMHKRNRAMVDACDCLLAVYVPHKRGGTQATVQYAEKQNKQIRFIDPTHLIEA